MLGWLNRICMFKLIYIFAWMPGEEVDSISCKGMSILSLEELLSKVWCSPSIWQFIAQVLPFSWVSVNNLRQFYWTLDFRDCLFWVWFMFFLLFFFFYLGCFIWVQFGCLTFNLAPNASWECLFIIYININLLKHCRPFFEVQHTVWNK